MIRTFIAVELPDRFIPEIEKIGYALDMPGIKPVEPKQVHITLKFLGDINENDVGSILSALSHVNCRQFEAKIKGVGVFPKPSYIKVVWLGAEGNFDVLHDEVERVLSPFKFKKDHQFSPHATLARVRQLRDKSSFPGILKNLGHIDLGKMNVRSISLKKSTLTPVGPIYETLGEIRLKD
ncbi:MAG: RNA 2',3'-cyclic phosphodiesterase [Candidatus Methanoperedens sp.]